MLSDGKSFNAICKDTHSNKTTVSNYKKLVEGTKLPYVELLEKSDSELEQLLSSQLSKPSEDARKAPPAGDDAGNHQAPEQTLRNHPVGL